MAFLQARFTGNNTVAAKIRQTLQFLRDDGFLSFVNNRGAYTLRSVPMLNHEIEAIKEVNLWDLRESAQQPGMADIDQPLFEKSKAIAMPETREHLVETYVRHKGWAKKAKETFGTDCLVCPCDNHFNKPDGEPYIEVHHIVPLCEGGEDGVWNLSVLCAHHHRMAHFADEASKTDIRNYLLQKVENQLAN